MQPAKLTFDNSNAQSAVPALIGENDTPKSKQEEIALYGDRLKYGELTVPALGAHLKLNTNQINFVIEYMTPEQLGSNGREAAAKAYDYDLNKPAGKRNADRIANINLKHEGVITLMASILDTQGFNDTMVDRELLYIMRQNADLKAKMMAIGEYNKLHQRIKTISEVRVSNPYDTRVATPEQLAMLDEALNKMKIQYTQTKHLNLIDEHNNIVSSGAR